MSDFFFSVVMAAYDTADYIKEAIDSLISQSIGFDRIQLIIVDDGSKDETGKIIDGYADRYPNIFVIHKENEGVSAARNEGLKLVEGRYVNFMDSDDRMGKDVFEKVLAFFLKEEDCYVVSIPVYYFDQMSGEHILNRKFEKGTRIIDLKKEWDMLQMAVNSCFIKAEALKDKSFDTRLSYSEDARLLQEILLEKKKLGAVADAVYEYRYRQNSNWSAIQGSAGKKQWYLPCLRYYHQSLIDLCMERMGHVPRFIQYALAYELKWKLDLDEVPYGVLSDEEKQDFISEAKQIISEFDDEVILNHKELSEKSRLQYMRIKGIDPGERIARDSVLELDFIDIQDDRCRIEGRFYSLPEKEFYISVDCGERRYESRMKAISKVSGILFDEVETAYSFSVDLELSYGCLAVFGVKDEDHYHAIEKVIYGDYMPFSEIYAKMYYAKDKYLVTRREYALYFEKNSFLKRTSQELKLIDELSNDRSKRKDVHDAARKAALIRPLIHMNRALKKRPVWLFTDRINDGDDNAYVLYEYLKKKQQNADLIFAVSEGSKDFEKISRIGKCIDRLSGRYKILYYVSDLIFSSSADGDVLDPFEGHSEPYKDLKSGRRFIFLQHGATQNDVSGWLDRYHTDFEAIVCSSKREKDWFRDTCFYDENKLWLTGMPRFDRLEDRKERIITIAPTWRRYLVKGRKEDGTYILAEDFAESPFYRHYDGLLKDERLLGTLGEYDYRIDLVLHPMLQYQKDLFEGNDRVNVLYDVSYEDVYAESAMMVTDYSSAVFDFAYLYKPVLYDHFDKDEFFASHTVREGYFSYENDGFGEVEYDTDHLVDRIIEYMRTDCQMKEKYRERVDAFFEYHDHECCKRIADRI